MGTHSGCRELTRGITGIITFVMATSAYAQVPDLIEVSAQYLPPVPVADPQPLQVQVTAYDAALNVPIPFGDTTFLIPGASYHADSLSFANIPAAFTELRGFHSVDFNILFVQLLPDDWSLSLRVAPGLAGDFITVDDTMVRFNALALATHGFSESFVLGGGALANYAFGSWLPLPALYTEWKPTRELTVEMFFPAFLQAKLALWNRVELGYRAEVAGNAYAIRDERVTSAWPCTSQSDGREARPSDCLDHVAYSVISAGPTLNIRLFETVWWNSFAGHTLYRRFDLMNAEDEPVTGGAQELPNAWTVRSGLSWRIPTP